MPYNIFLHCLIFDKVESFLISQPQKTYAFSNIKKAFRKIVGRLEFAGAGKGIRTSGPRLGKPETSIIPGIFILKSHLLNPYSIRVYSHFYFASKL